MRKVFLLVFLILPGLSEARAEDEHRNAMVGVLEDDRSELTNWKEGPSKNRVIQPLFEKKGDEWIVSTVHAEDFVWTIAFDGKNRGSLKNRPHSKKSPLNTETAPGQILTIGKPSVDFSGWMDTSVNRPLVLISNGNFTDPDRWKPTEPSPDQMKQSRTAFRAEYPKVLNCNENEEPLPDPWDYKDSDFQLGKMYGSSKGILLATMSLSGGKCGINDGPFQQQTFLLRPDKSWLHLLPGKGTVQSEKSNATDDQRSMTLIDAGDYDNDGTSEVLFFVSGYNEDGYSMFYDSFQKSVMWTWHYH